MGKYSKGAKFENDVIKHLKENGLHCIRSAGSKGITDIVAFKKFTDKTYVYLIQCKYGNASMSKKDKKKLIDLAKEFGFIPLYIFRKKYDRHFHTINLLIGR